MNQTDRGNFRTKESILHSFTHSCLGRLVIFGAIVGAILLVGHFTVPDQQTMTEEMEDNIRQCILSNDSLQTDWIDGAINNVGYTFTHVDSTFDASLWEAFLKYNKMEYHRHFFYATSRIYNNLHPEGTRAGIGIFGIIIPTVDINDLIMRVEPIHKGYGKGLIRTIEYNDDYMGEQPHIKPYHYKGDDTQ